jgi:hypothetical protein
VSVSVEALYGGPFADRCVVLFGVQLCVVSA